jgi:hypothetical protein
VHIGLIGGMIRQERQFAALAAAAGHVLEFHSGEAGGRHAEELRTVIGRSDVVIIVTDQNSHLGVRLARQTARRLGRESILLARCGLGRFRTVLATAASRPPPPRA